MWMQIHLLFPTLQGHIPRNSFYYNYVILYILKREEIGLLCPILTAT